MPRTVSEAQNCWQGVLQLWWCLFLLLLLLLLACAGRALFECHRCRLAKANLRMQRSGVFETRAHPKDPEVLSTLERLESVQLQLPSLLSTLTRSPMGCAKSSSGLCLGAQSVGIQKRRERMRLRGTVSLRTSWCWLDLAMDKSIKKCTVDFCILQF